MTERTMTGLLRSAATLALLALTPTLAWAQTAAFSPQLEVRLNNEVVDNDQIVYGKIADCALNDDEPGTPYTPDATWPRIYTFSVDYPSNVPFVEAWLGTGDEDCRTLANRTVRSTVSDETLCVKVGSAQSVRNLDLQIPSVKLFDKDGSADGREFACDRAVGGTPLYRVFIIPLAQETTKTTGSEPSTIGTIGTLTATFTPFLVRPKAPEGVGIESGETRLGVTFDKINDSTPLTKYRAYFDFGSVAEGEQCGGTTILAAGQAVKNSNGLVRSSGQVDSSPARTSNLEGLENGQSLNAAVVTIDPAGNESLLSEVQCVARVATNGYWDVCQSDPECAKDFEDGCSLSPSGRGSAVGLSFFALALAALIRRRRRA